MAKDVLVVKVNSNISYEDYAAVCNYIKAQVGEEYHVIGVFNGIEIDCVTHKDKVFTIDGNNYSYDSIKKAIQKNSEDKETKKSK